ncbi:uncharacterized protein [Dermacentor albipictus]|uniref:uncharacterized protein isoform X3 n=1 Tax=Dermacentor albipictus TaxID=60249 RepID=UPI0038FC4F69
MSMASALLPPPKPMDPSHDPWIAWKTWKIPPARADLPASRHSGTWLRGCVTYLGRACVVPLAEPCQQWYRRSTAERGSAYVRHQLWRMTESSPGNAGNAPARTSDPARNIKARHNCSLLGMTPLRQWDAHRFVVTGFHQVSRQDGLTPCHLMLSLSGQLFARTWCYAAFSC